MKKRYTTLFLAFALLLTLLCACGQQSEQPESSGAEPTRSPGIEKPRPEKTKEIALTELYSEEGIGTSDGFPYNYSFHVPQIEDDTADAAAINQEIAATYGEAVKKCMESILWEDFYFTLDDIFGGGTVTIYHNTTGSLDPAESGLTDWTMEYFYAWEPEYEDLPMIPFSAD